MPGLAETFRGSWGRTIAFIALVAACSGRVDDRDENGSPGGSGGTEGAPMGGVGGTVVPPVGGSSVGTGVGGVGGVAGVAGVGGVGGSSFGTGGFIGCFVAGTLIATPSGSTPIEKLELGDLVLAYDEHAARVISRPVTATFVHLDQPVGVLPLSDGRSLGVTANHPIYLPDGDRYVEAGELEGDERLLVLGGTGQTTSAISGGFQPTAQGAVTVYNITVAGEHNYFAEGVLVHNKSGTGPVDPCTPGSWAGLCNFVQCLDPSAPSPEYVMLNQPADVDAGMADAGVVDAHATDVGPASEGGPTDAAPVNRESGIAPESGIVPKYDTGAAVCSGGSVPPNPSYLAFDVVNQFGLPPAVGIYAGSIPCNGVSIGEMWLEGRTPPPPRTKTTQCVRVPQRFLSQLTLRALSEGTEVDNPRFVSGCACPRPLILHTRCGTQGLDAGSCE